MRLRPKRPAVANQEPRRAKTQRLANARAPHGADLRQWARPGKKRNSAGPQAAGFEPNVRSEPGAGRAARANQRRRLAAPERWDTAPPRTVVCVSAAAGAGPQHSPGGLRGGEGPEAAGGGEREPRAAGLPRPPSWIARRPEPCR